MAFLSTADQDTLRIRFEQELRTDVRIVLFAEPPTGLYIPGQEQSQTGRVATQLLEEVAALSPKLRLDVHNPRIERELAQTYGVERSPAIVLLPSDDGVNPAGDGAADAGGASLPAEQPSEPSPEQPSRSGLVRFFGLPSGYEFMTLLEDLVDLSAGSTRLSDTTRQAVAELSVPVHLQVFVTPT
jgi:hypothetical protein